MTDHLTLLESTDQTSDDAAAARDSETNGGGQNASISRCENSFFAVPTSNNHTKATEYTYLTTMLRETKERVAKLQTQLQVQTRQNLSDGEALVNATRRIGTVETDLMRARAEIYKVNSLVSTSH